MPSIGPGVACQRRCLRALLVLAMLFLAVGCAGLTSPWTEPEVMVTSIKPQRIGLDEQSLLVGLRIRNPNDRMLPIKAMTYRLSLEGEEIASGGGALERQIPAFGEETAEVSLTSDAGLLLRKLPALAFQTEPWQYRIAGTVTVAGIVPIPYRHSGEIDPKQIARAALF